MSYVILENYGGWRKHCQILTSNYFYNFSHEKYFFRGTKR